MRQTGASTGGRLLAFEMTLEPGGHVPASHVHPAQEERFTVSAGRMRFRHGLRTIIASAGETVIVEPGTIHRFANVGPGVARALVEVRPALRMEDLLEVTADLAREGRTLPTACPARSSSPSSSASSSTSRGSRSSPPASSGSPRPRSYGLPSAAASRSATSTPGRLPRDAARHAIRIRVAARSGVIPKPLLSGPRPPVPARPDQGVVVMSSRNPGERGLAAPGAPGSSVADPHRADAAPSDRHPDSVLGDLQPLLVLLHR